MYGGPANSSVKALLDSLGLIPVVGWGGDLSSLCIQIGPGVHSASYEMNSASFSQAEPRSTSVPR